MKKEKYRVPVAHNSKGMTEQLAGKGRPAKGKKVEAITSSSPRTVFPKPRCKKCKTICHNSL